MKTDLINFTTVTTLTKGTDKPRGVESQQAVGYESNLKNQDSSRDFKDTLRNQSAKDEPYSPTSSTSSPTVQKNENSPQKTHKEELVQSKKEESDVSNTNIEETSGELPVEIPEELETDINEDIPKTFMISENPQQTQELSSEQKETESKINTILALLSTKINLKTSGLEKYVANLRESGKSSEEILTSLKKALEVGPQEANKDLKHYVLTIVAPDEGDEEPEKPMGSVSEKSKVELNAKATSLKMDVNEPVSRKTGQKNPHETNEKPGEKKPVVNAFDVLKQETDPTGKKRSFPQGDLGTEKQETPKLSSLKLSSLESLSEGASKSSEGLKDLQNTINPLLAQAQKNTDLEPAKNLGKTSEKTQMKQTPITTAEKTILKEKVIECISKTLDVKPEKVERFFSSNLIPSERLNQLAQTFKVEDINQFVKDNQALLSQIEEFVKLQNDFTSGTKTQFSFKSIQVDTQLVKGAILKNFDFNQFPKGFYKGEKLLFQTKETTFKVEKLFVRFSIKREASEPILQKPLGKMAEKAPVQRETSVTRWFMKSSFKTGYETSSQRIVDLNRLNVKSDSQTVSNKDSEKVFDGAFKPKDTLNNTTLNQEPKTSKQPSTELKKEQTGSTQKEHNTNEQQPSSKTTKANFEPALKNEQTPQLRNMDVVYKQIKDMTRLMARQNTRTELATIRLNPPELGKVSLEIVKEGNKISIVMQVETKDAQEILTKNSTMLATRLTNSGFDVQKVQVHMEKYEEQGEDQANEQGQNNAEQQNGKENQDRQNENDYFFDEDYSFADLLKGGIKENAG